MEGFLKENCIKPIYLEVSIIRNNSKGFILPLTMIMTFLLTSSLLHQIGMYEREKKFQFEQEQFFIMESLSQIAIVDLYSLFLNEELASSDRLYYEIGFVEYWKDTETDTVLYINILVNTENQRQRFGRLGIDKEKEVVMDWLEIRK